MKPFRLWLYKLLTWGLPETRWAEVIDGMIKTLEEGGTIEGLNEKGQIITRNFKIPVVNLKNMKFLTIDFLKDKIALFYLVEKY